MRLLDPTDAAFVTGTEESRQQARREWHRQRFVAQVMASQLEEFRHADLSFGPFSSVEHVPTGRLFRLRRDELPDLEYSNAIAYYLDASGTPVLLEPPPGPSTRQGLEAKQAAREERRSAPRPRPSWMTR